MVYYVGIYISNLSIYNLLRNSNLDASTTKLSKLLEYDPYIKSIAIDISMGDPFVSVSTYKHPNIAYIADDIDTIISFIYDAEHGMCGMNLYRKYILSNKSQITIF